MDLLKCQGSHCRVTVTMLRTQMVYASGTVMSQGIACKLRMQINMQFSLPAGENYMTNA